MHGCCSVPLNTARFPLSAVHNLAVALLSLDADEAPLVEYLSHSGCNALGRPLYDAKYALRLARDRDRCAHIGVRTWLAWCSGNRARHHTRALWFNPLSCRPRACVKLLSQLGLHQDAVGMALDQVGHPCLCLHLLGI